MTALIIENVDLELLEKQRKEAREFQMGVRQDSDGLDGILAMLDEWADNNYFQMKNNLKLANIDICLPDYFCGHHKPVLQIPVWNGMTGREVIDSIESEYNMTYEHLTYGEHAWPDFSTEEIRKLASEVLLDPKSKNVFPELEELTEEEEDDMVDSVYAFFILEEK